MITIVAAVSDNGVIGVDNTLPWHIPEDFAHFKRLTLNKPVIMGRKTFESIGRPLPNRTNIVITGNPSRFSNVSNVFAVNSLEEAITLGCHFNKEVCIIGGSEIYQQSMNVADNMVITRVHQNIQGDSTFPDIDNKVWTLTYSLHVFSDTACDICLYMRK